MRALAEHFGAAANRFSRRYSTTSDEQLWLLAAAAFGDAEATERAAEPVGLPDRARRAVRTQLYEMLTTGRGLPHDPTRAAAFAPATTRKRPTS